MCSDYLRNLEKARSLRSLWPPKHKMGFLKRCDTRLGAPHWAGSDCSWLLSGTRKNEAQTYPSAGSVQKQNVSGDGCSRQDIWNSWSHFWWQWPCASAKLSPTGHKCILSAFERFAIRASRTRIPCRIPGVLYISYQSLAIAFPARLD